MFIKIITAFKEIISNLFSLNKNLTKTIASSNVNIDIIDTRQFGRVDDEAFSSNGMVFRYDTLSKSINSIRDINTYDVVLLSADGVMLNQDIVKELSTKKRIAIISSRYEGVDDRFIDKYVDYSISIGPYILTNGEIPCIVLIDAITRYLFLKREKLDQESFVNNRLDFPCYTRPRCIDNMCVPKQLYSGNHKDIENWKIKYKIVKTLVMHPDIVSNISQIEREILVNLMNKIKEIIS